MHYKGTLHCLPSRIQMPRLSLVLPMLLATVEALVVTGAMHRVRSPEPSMALLDEVKDKVHFCALPPLCLHPSSDRRCIATDRLS